MEGIWGWLLWAVIIIISMISSASKAKRKREEDARRAADAARRAAEARDASWQSATYRNAEVGTGMDRNIPAGSDAKPAGGSFGRILEELSRNLSEQPSPTVSSRPLRKPLSRPITASAPRPMTVSEPAHTSHDYFSLEDGWERAGSSVEDFDAERGYVGGEISEQRTASASPKTAAKAVGKSAGTPATPLTEGLSAAVVDGEARLREILGGDFDLRRAIIETEILTPKYISH